MSIPLDRISMFLPTLNRSETVKRSLKELWTDTGEGMSTAFVTLAAYWMSLVPEGNERDARAALVASVHIRARIAFKNGIRGEEYGNLPLKRFLFEQLGWTETLRIEHPPEDIEGAPNVYYDCPEFDVWLLTHESRMAEHRAATSKRLQSEVQLDEALLAEFESVAKG